MTRAFFLQIYTLNILLLYRREKNKWYLPYNTQPWMLSTSKKTKKTKHKKDSFTESTIKKLLLSKKCNAPSYHANCWKKKNNYRFWHQLKVPFTVWFHKKRKNKNGQKNSILPINKQCKKVIAHKWGFKKPWKKQNKSWFKTRV